MVAVVVVRYAYAIFDWILVAMISQPAMQNQLSFFNAIRR